MHTVSWERICQPREYGGLGFRRLNDMNRVALVQLAWRFFTKWDCLLIQVLRAKYGDPKALDMEKKFFTDSHTWKGIMEG